MSKRKTWTDAEKAAVVEYAKTHPVFETASKFGCSAGSVSNWCKAAGVDKAALVEQQTAAATAASIAAQAEKREQLRVKLLDRALTVLDRMDGKFKTFTKLGVEVELDEPPANVCKDLAVTCGILIDKLRLEAGESTIREEVSHRYPDIAAMSDDELAAAIVREAEGITGGAAAKD